MTPKGKNDEKTKKKRKCTKWYIDLGRVKSVAPVDKLMI